jgi:hypothetical protein
MTILVIAPRERPVGRLSLAIHGGEIQQDFTGLKNENSRHADQKKSPDFFFHLDSGPPSATADCATE